MSFATVGGNLALSGSEFASINMSGSIIQGEFRLGSVTRPAPVWRPDTRLILRNTEAGSIQDKDGEDAWPELKLSGFQYKQLGGLGGDGDGEKEMSTRNSKWFVDWLRKDSNYTPQAYHQLAGVLRDMVHGQTANAVLFAGKKRERENSDGFKWLGMSLLRWTIGYGFGYRYFLSLMWVLAFTLIGAWVFSQSDKAQSKTITEMIIFSFDLLLPIVKLDPAHKIELVDPYRFYFYFHELVGYILGLFVGAGLSGITKK